MNELVVVDLPGSPSQFTYQGILYEKIIDNYQAPNLEITVPETFSTIDDGLIYPIVLSNNNYISINNETVDDYTTVFVQTSGNTSNITVTDPFMDTSILKITSQSSSASEVSINIGETVLASLYDRSRFRLKGVLYEATHLGNHTQSSQGLLGDSAAFQIKPITETLLKTSDYNLMTSMDGDHYIDLIDSPLI